MSEVEVIFEGEGTHTMSTLRHDITPPGGTAFDFRAEPPSVAPMYGVHLAPAAARLWRVVAVDGRVIGHLQSIGDGTTAKYAAKRFHVASRAFRDLGQFWSADDAIQTLVFSR
jgi:hypothetical protein